MNFLNTFSSAINAGRTALDAGKSSMLERYLQHELGEAGTVSNLALDSRVKTLAFDLALKGEADSLRIEILRYAIERNERGTWLVVHEAKTSREWANTLAKKFLPLPPSRVPDWAASIVPLLL